MACSKNLLRTWMVYVFLEEKPYSQSGILILIIERIGGALFTVYSQV
jgi:hypothetical protein